jgi:hypothetical protein
MPRLYRLPSSVVARDLPLSPLAVGGCAQGVLSSQHVYRSTIYKGSWQGTRPLQSSKSFMARSAHPSSSTRRVQFLDPDTNTVLTPVTLTPPVIPLTPSPTYSDYSLPSPGPITPPSLPHRPLSQPWPQPNTIQSHPAIAAMCFDIAHAPSRIPPPLSPRRGLSPGPLSPLPGFEPAVLDEPATYPPLPHITLISEFLPWCIHVEASDVLSVPVVTVFDVLHTLHLNLRVPIVQCEWANLPPHMQSAVTSQFYQRLDGIRDINSRDDQMRKGVRRIDYLCGRTRLVGLSPIPDKLGGFIVSWGPAV